MLALLGVPVLLVRRSVYEASVCVCQHVMRTKNDVSTVEEQQPGVAYLLYLSREKKEQRD